VGDRKLSDKKISELTALTGANVADTDLLPIVDTSATETKKITFGEFKTALDTATGFVRITGDTMTGALTTTGLTVAGNLSVDGGTIKLDGNYPVGTNNVALGDAALDSNVSGASNVAIGADALTANTASNNTAVGYQAGYTNSTGASNTFLGYAAGYTNDTGNYNTLVGRAAGLALTTGSANTFVGGYDASTGGSGAEMTTGSNNTILGSYNGNQGGLDIRTASNNIVLSDGDGNPRVIVDSSGNVGIGVAPATRLDVAGSVNGAHATFSGQAGRGLLISTANTLSNDDGVIYNAQTAGSGKHIFQTAGTERMRINGYGSVSVGGDTTLAQWFNADGTYGTKFQVQTLADDTDQNYVTAAFIKSKNDTSPSYVVIGKNRGGAANSDTAINGSDSIGAISFQAADGESYLETGRIESKATAAFALNQGQADMIFYANNGGTGVATKMTIKAGGDVNIADGNLVIGTAGHGIDFSAQTGTATGTTTAELLDHYEQGTWTAELKGSTGSATTPVTETGTYTKVGNVVTVHVGFANVTTTGASGSIQVIGLPFTNTSANPCAATLGIYTNLAHSANSNPVVYINASANLIQGTQLNDSAVGANWNITATTGVYLYVSADYTV
jgi:hypothetical protein